MIYDYNTFFTPFANNFKEIKIPDDKIKQINDLIPQIAKAKETEIAHIIDGNQELTRFTTGFLGKAAIEEYLKKEIIDWSVGASFKYSPVDIIHNNVKLGIRTVEYGKFPIIYKNNFYAQIICVLKEDNCVLICGIATKDVLNEYQTDDLILSPYLKSRGIKTGFYGFEKLIPIDLYFS